MSTVLEPPPESVQVAPASTPAIEPTPAHEPGIAGQPRHGGGIVGGLILVGLGVAALIGNLLPTSGGLLFIGLGAAFLIARVLTGHWGYAVPSGILLAFGSFVALTETRFITGREAGGLFFIMLGLGFLAAYAIAAQPRMVWPIIPASALIGFGLLLQGWLFAWPFEQLVWLSAYWPVALIVFGGWLLLRGYVPSGMRAPLTIVGIAGLILVGFVVAAAGITTVTAPATRFMPFPAWPVMPMFGAPPVQDTIVLSSPIAPGDTLRVSNPSGRTTVRGGASRDVRVEAVRHYWTTSGPPQIELRPTAGALTVQATQDLRGPTGAYVDYVIDVPSFAGVDVGSTSGDLLVSGLGGAVAVRTTSGDMTLADLTGPVSAESTSGRIRGTGIAHLVTARSSSGDVDFGGTFSGDATVVTTSGDVMLRFEPATSARIDASSLSGTVRTSGPGLPATREARSQLVTLGSGTALIYVRTTSGSISLFSR